MGIQSNVLVAVKAGPVLEQVSALPIFQEAVLISSAPEIGSLWYFEYVKWYVDTNPKIAQLYAVLKEHLEECCVVTACFEHPEYADDDLGCWDSPWDLRKVISVDVAYT